MGGQVQAHAGSDLVGRGKLDEKNINTSEFRVEVIKISKVQLIEIRSLFKKLGLNTTPNQESVDTPKVLEKLSKLVAEAGGDAPLPKQPETSHLADLTNRVGNVQLKVIHEQRGRLEKEITEWQDQSKEIT